MKGSIQKRNATSLSLVIDQGRGADGKRKQRWIAFTPKAKHAKTCTAKTCSKYCKAHAEAAAKLAEMLSEITKGTYVDASKTTFSTYLRDWHTKNVVPHRRPETVRVYGMMIDHVAAAPIGDLLLQRVRTSDLEAFYASLTTTLAPASIGVLHAVVHRALKVAVRDRLLVANPASAVEDRPRVSKDHGVHARQNCWTADEARKVLKAAKTISPQVSAFVAFLLDTGARKSEALGVTWADLDLDAGVVTIARQLEPRQHVPTWGPTKTGRSRTIPLGADTITRLREHRRVQAVLKMKNRVVYRDHGLIFAMEPADLQTPTAQLGYACPALTTRYFQQVITAAQVRPITPHGTRHTVATLALAAGVAVQVVAQRLGHASPVETLNTYGHVLPDMQREAAVRLAAVLAER